MEEEPPWRPGNESPFTRLLPQDPSRLAGFYRADVWHTVNLGVGKSWVASAMVLILPLFEGGSVPARLVALSNAYFQFCRNSETRQINFHQGFHQDLNQHILNLCDYKGMVGSSGHSRFDGFQVPKKLRYITKPLTRDSLGWESFSSCPEGGWNKGALTATFLQFLQHWTQQNNLEHSADERLRLVDSWLMKCGAT